MLTAENLKYEQLTLFPAAGMKSRRVRWLWHNRMPLAHSIILGGKPDVGKSQFCVWLAAQISRGDLDGEYLGQPKSVIYICKEDDWEFTIRPRLQAAKADLDRVFRIEKKAEPGKVYIPNGADLAEIRRLVIEHDVALLIYDPLMSQLTGSQKDAQDVRSALEPLEDMLRETGCSIVGIAHFRKMDGVDALQMIAGSVQLGAVVRAALAFVKDPDSEDEKRIILSQAKNNLGNSNLPNMTYTFEECKWLEDDGEMITVSRIVFGEDSAWSVEDILEGRNTDAAKTQTGEAETWLETWLAAVGPQFREDVMMAADEAGHTRRTVDRAKKALGKKIKTVSVPGTKKMKWEVCQLNGHGKLGKAGKAGKAAQNTQ